MKLSQQCPWVRKRDCTPGASKQHKFDSTEVFWHDCGPVVEHADETKDDRSNSDIASPRPTKTWESNNSRSISRSRQFGKGIRTWVSRWRQQKWRRGEDPREQRYNVGFIMILSTGESRRCIGMTSWLSLTGTSPASDQMSTEWQRNVQREGRTLLSIIYVLVHA